MESDQKVSEIRPSTEAVPCDHVEDVNTTQNDGSEEHFTLQSIMAVCVSIDHKAIAQAQEKLTFLGPGHHLRLPGVPIHLGHAELYSRFYQCRSGPKPNLYMDFRKVL